MRRNPQIDFFRRKILKKITVFKEKNKVFLKVVVLVFFCFSPGCFYFISPIRKAEKALERGDCKQARKMFSQAVNKDRVVAEKAARLCVSKSIEEAVWFYDYLSKREEDKEKRLSLKEKLAGLYFENLEDYEKAVELYSFLRNQEVSSEKKQNYSFRIARSYFELRKWDMSLKEVDALTAQEEIKNTKKSFRFKINKIFLKARILLMQEKYSAAEEVFRSIQRTAPDYFEKNKLFFYLSFIYESRKEFHQAIVELESFQSTSDFLADKIKRLKTRQNNQPGTAFGGRL